MGEYFKIVNPSKKQYIDAIDFGEGIKRGGILQGMHGLAVACLVCKGVGVGPLVGSWAGDQIIVAGDYSQSDEWGIITGTNDAPDRNLYSMAKEEFENISHKALVMLCGLYPSFVDEFASRAGSNDCLLMSLSYVVFELRFKPIEIALIKHIGKDWPKRLKNPTQGVIK